ncbi:MAG: hypothetical protein C0601_01725 [Candidatus Muiribacterium halophilum]|uniref:Haloacid dehalogenase n=1 Tax=Muiribacterium halophilum TaxID=2053465 RepID=A0A2N5ZLI5_MUIH1|nr:MAG: hypothetical protein C0601_01725 [Candidatus Muirbacterium halophilum]
MKNINVIFFDMDGVLFNSEEIWHPLENEYLNKLTGNWSKEDMENVIGMHIKDIHEYIKQKFNIKLTFRDLDEKYLEMANFVYGKGVELFPGVMEFIKKIKKEHKVFLVSSSTRKWIDIASKRFEFNKCFDEIISGDDVYGKGKPLPDIYNLALDKANVSANEAVAIEDSYNGIISAKRAGIFTVGFYNGYNKMKTVKQAHIVIDSFENIDFIKEMINEKIR